MSKYTWLESKTNNNKMGSFFDIKKETEPITYTLTYEQQLQMYDDERKRLMELPKEALVEMLIGKRCEVGHLFG